MNRTISQHTLPIDENSAHSESRLPLNSRGYLFLSVVVLNGKVVVSFEEETVGRSANESLFVYKAGESFIHLVHNRGEHLATFVHKDEIYYLYGKRTNRQ